MQALCSLSLFKNFSPKNPLSVCSPLKILVKEPLKSSDHSQSPAGFLLSILFVTIILNARFSIAGKVQATELYIAFWDISIPRCDPLVFGKPLSLGCWSCLSFFLRDP